MDEYNKDKQLVKKDKKKHPVLAVGMFIFCGNLVKNAIQQCLVMKDLCTAPLYTRLSSFQATLHFPSTIMSAGSGANVGIQLIHSILGSVGQQQGRTIGGTPQIGIGTVFNDPFVQKQMAIPITSWRSPSNLKVATIEWNFWCESLKIAITQFRGTPSDFGRVFGGILGSVVYPDFRAMFQFGAAKMKQTAPGLLNPRLICGMTGIVGTCGVIMCIRYLSDLTGTLHPINPSDSDRFEEICEDEDK